MHDARTAVALVVLVAASTLLAAFAERRRVPAPSVLVAAGLGAALIPGVPAVHVSPELISVVVLPPLLYASAQDISARELRAMWRPLAALAFGLVLATACAIAGLAWWITSLGAPMAFVLGAVLASTDPVAVTALGRRLPLPPRLQALVQAESLFNDATSLVLFQVAVGIAVGSSGVGSGAAGLGGVGSGGVGSGGVDWAFAGWRFVVLAGGGAGVGAALALLVNALRARVGMPLVHTLIALATPYVAYLVGQGAGVSGVTAVVVAGVVVGSAHHRITDARIPRRVHGVYRVVVFLLESVVFALIGLQLPTLVRALPSGERWWALQAAALAAALIVLRVLWMRPTAAYAGPARGHPPWPVTWVMSWAGTRGVMPLAAALTIPMADGGSVAAGRPLVLVLTTAVVATTLIVQGLTLAAVVRASGLAALDVPQPSNTPEPPAAGPEDRFTSPH